MRYYTTQRPAMPGTFPMKGAQGLHNFDQRTVVPEIGREAWGYIDYNRELTPQEVNDYELVAAGEVKTWFAVMVTVWDQNGPMMGATQAAIMDQRQQADRPEGWERQARGRYLSCTWYDSIEAAQAAIDAATA